MQDGRRVLIATGLCASLVLTTACGPGPDLPTGPAPPVISVEPGLTPRLTAEQVAGIVLQGIHADEQAAGRVVAPARIVRMSVTTSAKVDRVEPNAGRGPGNDIVWVVRALGTFTNRRTPPGAEPGVAGSGYYVIADADGSVVGFGFP